jgi:outer membrane protein TolC
MQETKLRFKSKHIKNYTNKNKKFVKLFISIYFLTFQFISLNAQPDSLLRYLEIAAKNNPGVLQKFIEYEAALQKIPQAGTLPDPQLSIGIFLKPMELVNGNQVADLRLMQMFPWFGVLKYGKDEMSLMAKAKFELFRDAKLQVSYEVQRSWYDLYKVQKDISISEKNIEILKIVERLALIRFKAAPSVSASSAPSGSVVSASQNSTTGNPSGMETMGGNQRNATSSSNQSSSSMQTGSMGSSSGNSGLADLYRIQIETGDLENNIASLKNQERTISAIFNSYLNRRPVTPIFTGDINSSDSLEFSLLAVNDSMLAKNPMLSMLGFEKQSIEARKKMVTRMGYPMVGLGLNYSLISKSPAPMGETEMNGKDMLMPMVTLTLPIYRKKYNAMKTEADLLSVSTSQNYQATANSLQTEYYQAVQQYQDAKRRVKLYENQYLLASKSFDLVLRSFSTSSSTLTDVLRVRQQTLDYELKQVEALADFNTAIAWLKRLMAYSQIQ